MPRIRAVAETLLEFFERNEALVSGLGDLDQ
jgi:hypothetical protein